ncbi:MAG: shikimate dehydrogenase, partial [Bacteroidota bacterium]|nr:shikimate dehydrogenase [Bacteroidota bacterium]
TDKHLAYDLIYNPEQTAFLKQAKDKGATTINGLSMLHLQAEKSWEIWTNDLPLRH